jgi:cytoskeletal protein RodZ
MDSSQLSRRRRRVNTFLVALQVFLLVFSAIGPTAALAVEPSEPPASEEPSTEPSTDPSSEPSEPSAAGSTEPSTSPAG